MSHPRYEAPPRRGDSLHNVAVGAGQGGRGLAPARELEERLRRWATSDPDVRAAVVVGSFARDDHPADEWSDLDVGLIVRHATRFRSDDRWLEAIGQPVVRYRERPGRTWHVLFADRVDAGIAPIPVSTARVLAALLRTLHTTPALLKVRAFDRAASALHEGAAAYVARGARVLIDKDGTVARALRYVGPGSRATTAPSRDELGATVHEFFFSAVWTAKHLRRGELWRARTIGVDGALKRLLLSVLEWDTHVRAPETETWEHGQFLEEWAHPSARAALATTFARYERDDSWRALFATIDLFRRLATNVATAHGYPYPEAADAYATALVTSLHREQTGAGG